MCSRRARSRREELPRKRRKGDSSQDLDVSSETVWREMGALCSCSPLGLHNDDQSGDFSDNVVSINITLATKGDMRGSDFDPSYRTPRFE